MALCSGEARVEGRARSNVKRLARRPCPICQQVNCEVLRHQRFVLPEGHPPATGYDLVCCQNCGFVYADTRISQHDYDRFYSQFSKYGDRQTATGGGDTTWDADRLRHTASYIDSILPDTETRILDIGCANGGLLRALKDLRGEGDRLCGVDPSPICVANTREFQGLESHIGFLPSLPNHLGQFDCVILSHVLEHVSELGSAIENLDSCVRPGGYVYVETPDASRYAEFLAAPFQDFNTEHINHFSLCSAWPTCLDLQVGSASIKDRKWSSQHRVCPIPPCTPSLRAVPTPAPKQLCSNTRRRTARPDLLIYFRVAGAARPALDDNRCCPV